MDDSRLRVGDSASLIDRLQQVLGDCRQALRTLSVGGESAEGNVHFLRKSGKRLRGGLEMLGAPRRVIQELRDSGRLLAVSRDSVVRLDTLHALCATVGDEAGADSSFEVALRQLEFEAKLGGTPPKPTRDFVNERLDGVAAWLEAPRLDGPPGVKKRMARLVSRARGRLGKLASKPKDIEDYHDARKAAKALLGAAQFLYGEPGKERAREIKRLDRLGEDFGWIQDLDVLRNWLDERGMSRERLPKLHRALDAEIRKACTAVRRRAKKCSLGVLRVKR